mmetsp:Transcript_35539/g.57350  ORF Transcript_35539/g.57350 Transcript_35539/m.57350 type:complete len:245 (+) Transcript_35539:86-820(+)
MRRPFKCRGYLQTISSIRMTKMTITRISDSRRMKNAANTNPNSMKTTRTRTPLQPTPNPPPPSPPTPDHPTQRKEAPSPPPPLSHPPNTPLSPPLALIQNLNRHREWKELSSPAPPSGRYVYLRPPTLDLRARCPPGEARYSLGRTSWFRRCRRLTHPMIRTRTRPAGGPRRRTWRCPGELAIAGRVYQMGEHMALRQPLRRRRWMSRRIRCRCIYIAVKYVLEYILDIYDATVKLLLRVCQCD